jgi:hypothetical protein
MGKLPSADDDGFAWRSQTKACHCGGTMGVGGTAAVVVVPAKRGGGAMLVLATLLAS